MPYIRISFNSAKLFIESATKGSDFISDISTQFNSKNEKKYKGRDKTNTILVLGSQNEQNLHDFAEKPFNFEQVSNMLHVLLGARPVPSIRETIRKRVLIIDEIAKNTWVKINNKYFFHDKFGNLKLISEFIQGKKVTKDSNVKNACVFTSDGIRINGCITWSKLKQAYYYNNNQKYHTILNLFEKLYGNKNFKDDFSLVDFIIFLSKDSKKKEKLCDFFEKNGLQPLSHLANGDYDKCGSFNNGSVNQNNFNLSKLQNNHAVKQAVEFYGEFIVPIDNKLAMEIMNGTKCATFLDGGFCYVKEIFNNFEIIEDDLIDDGFIQMFK